MSYDLDIIAQHFCIAAVWAGCKEGTRPRITRKSLDTARKFATSFLATYPQLCTAAMEAEGYGSHPDTGSPEAAFGHDLYLTAAGHGTGFWDRDELGDTGRKLGQIFRNGWRRWYIEIDFYRGWLYVHAPNIQARS